MRGEWYVIAQLLLIALVFFGPRTVSALPAWYQPFPRWWSILGSVLMVSGFCLLVAGLLRLGSNLTPLPYPKENAALIQTGPYSIVRHPMYAGGLVLAYGWALFVQGWLTILYATVLLIFLDIKSTREERWLVEKFPEYAQYQRRVRKLIPFIH